ncbi:lamin tail domain-containing protein [Nannocystis radixulma]|uniref:Lamin tail domain-containing protein n=1 Tax=Nannocystis radixulma TaxID=2995305 RepID=A0ABT5BP72_9BACT|nr:lamin tail domain-containing protein [Nannocystis radixulma]MDC0675965.1 lamin tail domain-containing protein [Nannocystis radixulma]
MSSRLVKTCDRRVGSPSTKLGPTGESTTTNDETTTTTGAVESCQDGEKNGDETDTDCGGASCPACADGSACVNDSDCQGMSCVDNTCGPPAPTCDDAIVNGDETDIDCGGPDCAPCDDDQACQGPADCQSQVCSDGLCQAPTCSDGAHNGSETDVDCGGPECDPCAAGLGCDGPQDCESGVCDGVCAVPNCNDDTMNGDETDVDCGGDTCDPCEDAISCQDGLQNGQETGVDCGGPACPACPTPGLVINEVDYDQPGNDNAEFIEILNTTGAPIDLTNHAVVLVNGANNTIAATINLNGMIAAGQYLVLANANFAVPPGALKVNISNGIVQNGGSDPDGIALVNKSSQKLIDALSYDGSITAINIPGVGVVSLVEGMALPANVIDNPAGAGSLARLPNGQDSNNAATDWKFTGTPTPGAANVP